MTRLWILIQILKGSSHNSSQGSFVETLLGVMIAAGEGFSRRKIMALTWCHLKHEETRVQDDDGSRTMMLWATLETILEK